MKLSTSTPVLVLALLMTPLSAIAADSDPRASDASTSIFGDKTDISIGVGTLFAPRYYGSSDYRAQLLPVLSVQRGIFFLDSTRGTGVQFETESGFSASQSIYYDLGRLDKDSDLRPGSKKLAGMGNVHGSVTTRTQLMQQFTPWLAADAEAEFALKEGAHRNRYRVSAKFTLAHTEKDSIGFDLNTHFGNSRFNQAYFGVTDKQSTQTPFHPYKTHSGLYAYSVSLSWDHAITSHWNTSLQVTGMRYADNVGDSPIVNRRSFATGLAAVTYTF